jgi:hypothetical protein
MDRTMVRNQVFGPRNIVPSHCLCQQQSGRSFASLRECHFHLAVLPSLAFYLEQSFGCSEISSW